MQALCIRNLGRFSFEYNLPRLSLYHSCVPGVDFQVKTIRVDDRNIAIQLWDTAGIHCKEKMPKIWSKYSQKRNIGASVPLSTFICLWVNYIFPRWSCRFCWRKDVDRSWEYINRSQTHECRHWGWGRAIPRKGIYKRNCHCSVDVELHFGIKETCSASYCNRQ
jgi:hypothetical protein